MNPVQFYKCLADDTRLRSLLLISEHAELCVCELTEALALSQPKVSRHLAQLRRCGLLSDRREGQWVFYAINSQLPAWAQAVLRGSSEANRPFVAADNARLAAMADRPERCCS
ncbi:MAG: metalloregulator ArsR/SmtB family transcription factor [Cellvibrionaceae bacterium]|nr:metalloregulator ArsR/SmtB family transcription factor [Cellvibrionaceae bacterium]